MTPATPGTSLSHSHLMAKKYSNTFRSLFEKLHDDDDSRNKKLYIMRKMSLFSEIFSSNYAKIGMFIHLWRPLTLRIARCTLTFIRKYAYFCYTHFAYEAFFVYNRIFLSLSVKTYEGKYRENLKRVYLVEITTKIKKYYRKSANPMRLFTLGMSTIELGIIWFS